MVKEYVPLVVTVIVWVVSPVDHIFPAAAEEVKVTDPPSQNVVGPLAVIVGAVAIGTTVTTVATDVAEQPPVPLVTVYDPEVVTVIDCVVAPFDHVFPVGAEEVNVTEPPEQKVKGPLAEMVGTIPGVTVTTRLLVT